MIEEIIRSLLTLLEIISLAVQLRHIHKTKAIYGFSADFALLYLISRVSTQVSAFSYKHQRLTISQYEKRFPLYPVIVFDYFQYLNDGIIIVLLCGIVASYVRYRNTRHEFQFVSKTFLVYLTISLLIPFWILYNSRMYSPKDMGRYGFFYLDFIDSLWLFGTISDAFKLCPQISLNWLGMCVKGISPIFIKLESCRLFFLFLLGSLQKDDFHLIPINRKVRLSNFLEFFFTIVMLFQFYAYKDRKPYLPARFEIKDEERND